MSSSPSRKPFIVLIGFEDGILVWRGETVNTTKPETEAIVQPIPLPKPGCITTVTSTKGTALNVPRGPCTSTVIVTVDAPPGLGGIIAGMGGFADDNPVAKNPAPIISTYSTVQVAVQDRF